MKVTFIDPNLYCLSSPNLGLAYLISSVEKEHQVNLIDLTFHAHNYQSYLLNELKKNPPDVIGLSVTTFSFQLGLKIAYLVKQIYPEVPIIFGGIHPTLLPDETIIHPQVDAVCIGEGEETMMEYLGCVQNHTSPEKVAGLWYKGNTKIIKNPLRFFKEDLDSLPFPNWDYWEIEKYINTNGFFVGTLTILASRGCPYNCSFCSNPALRKLLPGKFYRQRSPGNIIEEIKFQKQKYWQQGMRNISFGDEVFAINGENLGEFCQAFRDAKLNRELSWTCGIRAELVTDDWAKETSRAGCAMVYLGVESGDDYIRLQVYNKNISSRQIIESCQYLRNNNIAYQFSIMVGCYEETKETIEKSRLLVKKTNPVMVHFSYYLPLPKTDLLEKLKMKNAVIETGNLLKKWNSPRVKSPKLTAQNLRKTMWLIRKDELIRFIKSGWKLRRIRFLTDIIKYLGARRNSRYIALTNPYIRIDLARKTIHRYILESWREKQQYL